jgi:hypothetical protein
MIGLAILPVWFNLAVAAPPVAMELTADELVFDDGEVTATNAHWFPCGCEGDIQPWSVQAAQVWANSERLKFQRARLRVLGVPVPVPNGALPLSRRSGFLAPSIGFHDGLHVATPLYLATSTATDVTLTPELRTTRSLRLLGEGRWATRAGNAQLNGAFGRDWLVDRWRGGGRLDVMMERPGWRVASQAEQVSDLDYRADFADAFLDRRAPWVNSRAVLGFGSFEIDHWSTRGSDVVTQQPIRVALYQPIQRGGWLGFVSARSAGVAQGAHLGQMESLQMAHDGQARWSRPTVAGPLMFEPIVSAQAAGITDEAGAYSASAGAGLHTRLLGWRRTLKAYERFEPQLDLGARVGTGNEMAPIVRPGIVWRRTSKRTTTDVAARMDLSGQWDGAARAAVGSWTLWTHGEGGVQSDGLRGSLAAAGTGLDTEWFGLNGGWMWAAPERVYDGVTYHRGLANARWVLPGPLSVFTLTGGGTAGARGADSGRAGVSYQHPSKCVSLGLTGETASDGLSFSGAIHVLQ